MLQMNVSLNKIASLFGVSKEAIMYIRDKSVNPDRILRKQELKRNKNKKSKIKVTKEILNEINICFSENQTISGIAKKFNLNRKTIYFYKKKFSI
jgi:predicted DNA-binding protein YlxM (UPF0122 family)